MFAAAKMHLNHLTWEQVQSAITKITNRSMLSSTLTGRKAIRYAAQSETEAGDGRVHLQERDRRIGSLGISTRYADDQQSDAAALPSRGLLARALEMQPHCQQQAKISKERRRGELETAPEAQLLAARPSTPRTWPRMVTALQSRDRFPRRRTCRNVSASICSGDGYQSVACETGMDEPYESGSSFVLPRERQPGSCE